ncbi:unnamed protein product [Rotaria socialis]|uniref:Uncharacterized protein n=1 Tax=Rotaria socialis TaxID=392032 RepID=A0A818N4J5_9BILA|nr:unnamed protein product [Rotaria socialis]
MILKTYLHKATTVTTATTTTTTAATPTTTTTTTSTTSTTSTTNTTTTTKATPPNLLVNPDAEVSTLAGWTQTGSSNVLQDTGSMLYGSYNP